MDVIVLIRFERARVLYVNSLDRVELYLAAAPDREDAKSKRSFPLDVWYPIAWSQEIGTSIFARKICDRDIVVYRRPDSEVAALEDAYRHRLLPLSIGRLAGVEAVCG